MTLLPIVERELRVRARRRSGHWSRFGIALGSFLIESLTTAARDTASALRRARHWTPS